MEIKWIRFKGAGHAERLPPERRFVLVAVGAGTVEGSAERRSSIVVGYLRFSAGDKASPYFVTPGFQRGSRIVTHFADVLGDDFKGGPGWEVEQPKRPPNFAQSVAS